MVDKVVEGESPNKECSIYVDGYEKHGPNLGQTT